MRPINKQIIQLVKSGLSYSAVATQLGVTRNVVAGVCHRNGVKTGKQWGGKDCALSTAQIADRMAIIEASRTREEAAKRIPGLSSGAAVSQFVSRQKQRLA